ncbi:hypothetical protein Taro_016550 [Colocasia esculenta]|uniref:Uncharacterized protein n=1 Tax=Colocasia esculenta TaxID=4460 RepID=A0A843UKM5_COLES|nr:hypothetical protein [Colocasia esculenta]
MRFHTLREGNLYPWATQRAMVSACCVVHNFIRREFGYDMYFNGLQGEEMIEDGAKDEDVPIDIEMSSAAVATGDVLREDIANQLWSTENR